MKRSRPVNGKEQSRSDNAMKRPRSDMAVVQSRSQDAMVQSSSQNAMVLSPSQNAAVQPNHYLPNELWLKAFSNIHSARDMSAVSHVCKDWKDKMDVDMWNTLHFLPGAGLDWTELVDDPFRRILSHVRQLAVLAPPLVGDLRMTITIQPLQDLFSPIPGRLTMFYCDVPLKDTQVLKLLSLQTNIQDLQIYLNLCPAVDKGPVPLKDSDRQVAIKTLHRVKTLHIKFEIAPPTLSSIGDIGTILRHASNVKDLSLEQLYRDLQTLPLPLPSSIFPDSGFHNLTALSLSGLSFEVDSEGASLWSPHVNFSELRTLEVRGCIHTHVFLDAVRHQFLADGSGLETLLITFAHYVDWAADSYTYRDEGALTAIEQLLCSFTGLQRLMVHTSSEGTMDLAAVVKHRESLEYLWLGSTQLSNMYSVSSLAFVLRCCPQLLELATKTAGFPDREPTGDDEEWAFTRELDRVHVPTEFEARLEVIGRHPKLHTLRALNQPMSVKVDLDMPYLQYLANEMLACLSFHGSKITSLAFSPQNDIWNSRQSNSAVDANGHRGPHYYYIKGERTIATGRKRVVAVPITSPWDTVPQSTVFLEDIGRKPYHAARRSLGHRYEFIRYPSCIDSDPDNDDPDQ